MVNKRLGSGFTLLELIIVIIIIAVLASLAFPRFIRMVERTRAIEAINHLSNIRAAVERCYLMKGGGTTAYTNCLSFSALGIDDPSGPSKFVYEFLSAVTDPSDGSVGYALFAWRDDDSGIYGDCLANVVFTVGSLVSSTMLVNDDPGGISLSSSSSHGTHIKGYCIYDGMEW